MYVLMPVTLLAVYFINLIFGMQTGKPFFGDVAEALLLLATSVAFVVLMLRSEVQAKQSDQ